jgi:ABC-type Mn2+/Zn2+ transport system ATPase subunit
MEMVQPMAMLPIAKVTEHNRKQPILELTNVSAQFDKTIVLDNLSFQLRSGERVAIIGPNGAGKSTLFNIIAGILSPTKGKINLYGSQSREHICIAYVPQRNQVNWDFPVNVADVVMMGRVGKLGLFNWPKQKDWQKVYKSLELVGMTELAKRQISELSGGQQQKVFIARALAQEADLMLMDEPLNGLDVKSQESIFEILNILREHNVTVMVSTHDLNLAGEHFDRLMLLKQQIIAFGKTSEVFKSDLLSQAYGGRVRLLY